MASFSKSIDAGNDYAFLGIRDSNGFLVGQGTSAPSQGASGSAMFRLLGIKEAPVTAAERSAVVATGDNGKVLATFNFLDPTPRSFVIELAVDDLERDATILGTTVQTIGEIKLGAYDIIDPAEINVSLILQSNAKKWNTGVVGQAGWGGYIIPLATAVPLSRNGFSESTPGVFRLQVTPQTADMDPWGITITDSTAGTAGLGFYKFDSEYPITMHAHTGTGALSTFTLDYKPVSAAKTKVYSARVAQTTTSVSTTAPYSVTISGTPIGGAQMVTIYEFQG